ncbi:hypothetical protein [Conexibacter woesei]|uniref:Uncharacterized protein n=1 Tax=Conexibacter woesei (strain DSM 14684 / CCUG 47730 / CIP 108061 / JCM 11494 / NBRC 100937 / ID131577) TaxID=469383 RepID=D3EZ66_CONWI|nr:hypothetical protein [Conexibacter woesei]ADB51831.1 hypothetical protein Cwoe_3413 [Conexibacter woesei DSM 14684]
MSAFFDELERELRRATVRRAAAQRAARVSLLRRAPIAATVAAALLIAVSAAAGFVALRPQGPDATTPSGRQGTLPAATVPRDPPLTSEQRAEPALRDLLAALRRPQHDVERDGYAIARAGAVLPRAADPSPARSGWPGARVLLPSVRRAVASSHGAVWLVPFRPGARGPAGGRPAPGDRIAVVLEVRRPGRSRPTAWTTGVTPPTRALDETGFVIAASDGASASTAALVPDGVRWVRALYADSPAVEERSPAVGVEDNVALLPGRTRAAGRAEYPRKVIWYDGNDRVIKRFRPHPPRP